MQENNNILIVVENSVKQNLLFKYLTFNFENNLCTYYNNIADIRIRNKHIKITTPDTKTEGSYDLIIIDSVLEYDKDAYKVGGVCSNIMVLDIYDIVEPLAKKTCQDIDLGVLQPALPF